MPALLSSGHDVLSGPSGLVALCPQGISPDAFFSGAVTTMISCCGLLTGALALRAALLQFAPGRGGEGGAAAKSHLPLAFGAHLNAREMRSPCV
jgi:hypothetical protein